MGNVILYLEDECPKCHEKGYMGEDHIGYGCVYCGWRENKLSVNKENLSSMINCDNCGNANCVPEDASCVICGEPVPDYKAYPPDDLLFEEPGESEIHL